MSKRRIFVGNFPFNTTEQQLRELFAPREIVEVRIIQDRDSGRSKGFGFVEFATDDEAEDALQLDGSSIGGRPLRISIANEKPQGKSGGGDRNRRDRDGGRGDREGGRGERGYGWKHGG